jgi:hypothetical protein
MRGERSEVNLAGAGRRIGAKAFGAKAFKGFQFGPMATPQGNSPT